MTTSPAPGLKRGRYRLIRKGAGNISGDFIYRLSHPLGEYVLNAAKAVPTPTAHLHFDVTHYPTRLAAIEALHGSTGWLTLTHLAIEALKREEHLLFNGFHDDGTPLDGELCERLFRCAAEVTPTASIQNGVLTKLDGDRERHVQAALSRALEQSNRFFHEERERLERWADDMVLGAEKELSDTKAQLRALGRQARLATTTDEQHALQLRVRELEKLQRRQRQRIFDVEDEIKDKRDAFINDLEARLVQRTEVTPLFTIRWSVV